MADKKKKDLGAEDDIGLLNACWDMTPGAWEEFLARFGKLVYYSIHRTCQAKGQYPDQDEVDDLFNDVLYQLLRDDCKKLRQYRGYEGATVATWIRTITVRYVIDHMRSKARAPGLVNIEIEGVTREISLANPVARPDETYADAEQDEILARAVGALGQNDRDFMDLYYYRGLDPEEIAHAMGISVKTVYSRVNRIKAKIQEQIEGIERK